MDIKYQENKKIGLNSFTPTQYKEGKKIIYEMLLGGKTLKEIYTSINYTKGLIDKIVSDLEKEHPNLKRLKRRKSSKQQEQDEKDLEILLNHIKAEKPLRELDWNYDKIQRLTNILIERRLISKGEIKANKAKMSSRKNYRFDPLSQEELKDFVLNLLYRGYSNKEIKEEARKQFGDNSFDVPEYKRIVLEPLPESEKQKIKEAIDEHRIEVLRYERIERIKNEISQELENGIELDDKELSQRLGYGHTAVKTLRETAIKKGKWFSEEELLQYDSIVAKKQKKKGKPNVDKDLLNTVRSYVKQGLSDKEISGRIHYDVSVISRVKREAKESGLWFCNESIKVFKILRKIREEETETYQRIDNDNTSVHFRKTYRLARKQAIAENKFDRNGTRDSIKSRENFFLEVQKIENLEQIPDEDIEILFTYFKLKPEMATIERIRFLIVTINNNRPEPLQRALQCTMKFIKIFQINDPNNLLNKLLDYRRVLLECINGYYVYKGIKKGDTFELLAAKSNVANQTTSNLKIALEKFETNRGKIPVFPGDD